MLDDDASRRLVKRLDALERRIRIRDIVVGQFLAGEHARGGDGAGRRVRLDVQGSAVVRVLAVAQQRAPGVVEIQLRRKLFDVIAVGVRAEPVRDQAVGAVWANALAASRRRRLHEVLGARPGRLIARRSRPDRRRR
jgi:hypothetical protein